MCKAEHRRRRGSAEVRGRAVVRVLCPMPDLATAVLRHGRAPQTFAVVAESVRMYLSCATLKVRIVRPVIYFNGGSTPVNAFSSSYPTQDAFDTSTSLDLQSHPHGKTQSRS